MLSSSCALGYVLEYRGLVLLFILCVKDSRFGLVLDVAWRSYLYLNLSHFSYFNYTDDSACLHVSLCVLIPTFTVKGALGVRQMKIKR